MCARERERARERYRGWLHDMISAALLQPALLPSPSSITPSTQISFANRFLPARFHLCSSISTRALSLNNQSPDAGPEPITSPSQQPARRKSKRPEKEKLPRGFRRYETMAILRPSITEDERIDWTQRYEEVINSGGGLSVEFSNHGIMPLAYNIKKKDTAGVTNRYLDGVYMLFNYVTKPQCQLDLQRKFNSDDDIIRSTTVLLK